MRLTPDGLRIDTAQVVEPAVVLGAWLGDVRRARVESLAWSDGVWRLMDGAGAVIDDADVVCLAAGMDCARLAPALPLHPVRGQASLADGAPAVDGGLVRRLCDSDAGGRPVRRHP